MSGAVATHSRPWWLPAIVLATGVAATVEGWRLPLGQGYSQLGPGFFVLVVGLALIALALASGYQLLRGVPYNPEEGEGVDLAAPFSRAGLALSAAAIITPLAAIPWLGFPVGGALSYVLVTHAFGSRTTLIDAAIGFAVAALTWLGFSKLGVDLGAFFSLWGR